MLLNRAAVAIGSVPPATTLPPIQETQAAASHARKTLWPQRRSTGAAHTLLYIKFKTEIVDQCSHFAVLKERKDFCCTHNFCFFKFTVQKYGGFVSISDTESAAKRKYCTSLKKVDRLEGIQLYQVYTYPKRVYIHH